jgi:hypothetical protein
MTTFSPVEDTDICTNCRMPFDGHEGAPDQGAVLTCPATKPGLEDEPRFRAEGAITATLDKDVWATIGLALADQRTRLAYLRNKSHSVMAGAALNMAVQSVDEALVALAGAMADFVDFGKDTIIPSDAEIADAVDFESMKRDPALNPQQELKHTIRGNGPQHRYDCPACVAANPTYAVDPRTDGYWQN